MSETLAVFRSRSQAMDCFTRLKAMGISVQLMNTPKEANVGCGLSIRLPRAAASRAKNFIARAHYSAFYGYLKMENRFGRFG